MKFVAVTSCPTGIAHTYMAAENLEQTGKDQGHDVQVETQGSAGTIPLSDEVIAAADGVIFAADLEVKGKERFAGKPFVDVGVKAAVHKPLDVMAAAVAAVENAPKAGTPAAAAAAAAAPAASFRSVRSQGRRRHQGPSVVDDRRLVHDPVRRCGRPADRPRIPVRRRGGRLQALWRNLRGCRVQGHRRHAAGRLLERRDHPDPAGERRIRRIAVRHRQDRLLHAGADPVRLHRLRHRRSAGPGARHRRRPDLRSDRCRLPRRSGLRFHRRWPGVRHDQAQGAEGRPRHHAGCGHPAGHHDPYRRHHVPGPRAAHRGGAERPGGLAVGPVRWQRHPARRDPGPDDGVRHGWSAEQGGLRVRRRRSDHRHHRRWTPACRSWRP